MIEKLLAFVMVLTRISAFFLVVPVFGWKSIPARVKVATTILVAIFFSMITTVPFDTRQVSALQAGLFISNEAIYGLALGLVIAIVFASVKLGSRIIERQMGLAMAQTLDPLSGETSQPLGMLMEMIFIVMFLSVNGHHLFLLVIRRSYEAFPAGSRPTVAVLTSGIIQAGSTALMAGLRLGAPILAVFLILMILLAVLARIAPQMNILFISLPLRVGIGLLMAIIFLPFVEVFVTEFADWMGKLLPL